VTTPPDPSTTSPDAHDHGHDHSKPLHHLVYTTSMVFGRGRMANFVADLARLTPSDRVVDVGCGPGTAVRVAARRCESATGVDPDPTMLKYGRWLTRTHRHRTNVDLVQGKAEALPLPDDSATVVWALTSVHHWSDRPAGLAEVGRVLAPGGRVFLVERLTSPGDRGHMKYGLTEAQLAALEEDLRRAGISAVRRETHTVGRETIAVVRGTLVDET
jgi:SAM-dependent methyltransferase